MIAVSNGNSCEPPASLATKDDWQTARRTVSAATTFTFHQEQS